MSRPCNPFGEERRRGHHYVGGVVGRGERERHYLLAIAGLVVGVIGAAAAGYSAYAASEAQSQAANYNKKVARNQAQAARDAASIAASNRQEELRRIMAAQRARIGASGVTEEGSPLLVEMKSAEQGQLDLARIAYAGQTRSQAYQSEAILQGFYATRAEQAAQVGAGTSLLNAAARVSRPGSGAAGANQPGD
jgi:hypothetical protein